MTADDLAHILRFLYGDERSLGLPHAALDLGTRIERLREMLTGRDIPQPWERYLYARVALRFILDRWQPEARALLDQLSAVAAQNVTKWGSNVVARVV